MSIDGTTSTGLSQTGTCLRILIVAYLILVPGSHVDANDHNFRKSIRALRGDCLIDPVSDTVTGVMLTQLADTDGVLELCRENKSVVKVSCGGDRISQKALESISQMTWLQQLSLPGGLTDRDLVYVKGLTHLSDLSLAQNKISDDGLKHLAELVDLEHLGLEETRVTGIGFKHLTKLIRLQDAGLQGSAASDEGLREVASIGSISKLTLDRCAISDQGARELSRMENLEVLSLRDTNVSDAGLQSLAKCPALVALHLTGSKVTEKGVARFHAEHQAKLRLLGKLDAAAASVHLEFVPALPNIAPERDPNADAIAAIEAAGGKTAVQEATTGAISVGLDKKSDIDAAISACQQLKLLTGLRITDAKLPENTMRQIAEFKMLKTLILNNCGITDDDVVHVGKLRNLGVLSLSENPITDAGVRHLKRNTKLQTLSLAATKITGKGLSALHFNYLNNLSLDKSPISDEGMKGLVNLSGLKSLMLNDTQISDAGLTPLVYLSNLAQVRVHNTKVTAAGIEEFQKKRASIFEKPGKKSTVVPIQFVLTPNDIYGLPKASGQQ